MVADDQTLIVNNIPGSGGGMYDFDGAFQIIDEHMGAWNVANQGVKRSRMMHGLKQNQTNLLLELAEYFTDVAARYVSFVNTEALLPLDQTDNEFIYSREFVFEYQIPSHLAPEGVADVTEHYVLENLSAMEPFGLNVKWEIGQLGTVQGKTDFAYSMSQVVKGALYGMEIRAMIKVKAIGLKHYDTIMNESRSIEWVREFQHARRMFGIGNKGKTGLISGLSDMEMTLKRRGFTPSTAVMNPGLKALLSTANELFIVYSEGGPAAPKRLINNTPVGTLMGIKFYDCPLTNQTRLSNYTTCLLDDEVQSGYYYHNDQSRHSYKLEANSPSRYNSLCGAIKMFRRDTDEWEVLQFADIAKNFLCWGDNGKLVNSQGDDVYGDTRSNSVDAKSKPPAGDALTDFNRRLVAPGNGSIRNTMPELSKSMEMFPFVVGKASDGSLRWARTLWEAYSKNKRLVGLIKTLYGIESVMGEVKFAGGNEELIITKYTGDLDGGNKIPENIKRIMTVFNKPISRESVIELFGLGVVPCFSYTLFRPHDVLGMSALTLTEGGERFGKTYMQPFNYTQAADNQSGTGSWQTRFKATEHINNSSMTTTEFAFFHREQFPKSGGNNRFFTVESYGRFLENGCRRDVDDSLLAIIQAFDEKLNPFHDIVDVTGYTNHYGDTAGDREAPHYGTSEYHTDRVFSTLAARTAVPLTSAFNRVLFRGTCYLHSGNENDQFDEHVRGNGMNKYDYPGFAEVRDTGSMLYSH